MEQKRLALLAILAGLFLLFGCAAPPQEQPVSRPYTPPAPQQPAPPVQQAQNETPPPPPPAEEQVAEPAQAAVLCKIYFQKSSSDIYMVAVRDIVPAGAEVEVRCSGSELAAPRGNNLFFCSTLSPGQNVTAYADGSICASAALGDLGGQQPPRGGSVRPPTCSINVSREEIRAGEKVFVDIDFSTDQSARIEWLCGDEVRSLSGGFGSRTGNCNFTQAGEVSVWIKVDGVECASVPLTVR